MLLHIPALLSPEEVSEARALLLKEAEWVDGRATAGHVSAPAKRNRQVRDGHPIARRIGETILTALERNSLFISAALPMKIVPPLFNRYSGGETYGDHVDGAIWPIPGTPHRVRTDLSATVFLTAPDAYDGGELVVQDTYGGHRVKLPAGDMILYPGSSLHRVEPVTHGDRISSFFWVQSMVRDDSRRSLLFDLDTGIRQTAAAAGREAVLGLTGVYHNLLRQWSDT